jgi:FAD/FMN-containing dehydrogenase/Fe-S oxidoreductase
VFPTHDRIRADLRGEFRGVLHTDDPHRAVYASDASPFHILPHAVAIPEDEDDLRTLVRYAHERGLPLVPRGAGTGLSGESLGSGVVVDLSVHFRRPAEVGPDWVKAGCGLTLREVSAALAPHGRRFAPNPLSADTCTVGGVVGTNASGPNVATHGYTREHVNRLRVVWDNGETATLTTSRQTADAADTPQLRTVELRSQTAVLLSKHQVLIEQSRPAAPFHRCPYLLDRVVGADGLDLCRLLTGSEGTLAFTTEAELRTVPLPGGVALGVGGFRSLNEALRGGLLLRACPGVVAADVFDQRVLSLARPVPGMTLPDGVAAALFVEVEADTPAVAVDLLRDAANRIRESFPFAVLADPTVERDAQTILAYRRSLVAATYSTRGSAVRPVPVLDDTAVPADELIRYVSGLGDLLRKAELPAVFHVSPLSGQVIARPLLDVSRPADREALWPLADRAHQLVVAVGGSISGRHGVGVARTPWVGRQYGHLLPVFAELKRVFDPKGILNPGKITAPDPSRPAWPLREPPALAPERISLLVRDDPPEDRCTGCGDCRTRQPPARMCPTFHPTGVEAASPRAKANLMHWLRGVASVEEVPAEEARTVADLCVNCKMCRTECPSGVDAPRLALEAKAALHAAHGFTRDEWVLARAGRLVRLAAGVPLVSNLLFGSRAARWVIEKLTGVSRYRTLPQLVGRPFMNRRHNLGVATRNTPISTDGPMSAVRVAYLVDTHTDLCDPLVGEATVAVLRHHGIEVYVPPRQRGTGAAALMQGDFDAARTQAANVVREFADLVREGYAVVASDPSAVVTVTQDYPLLLDDDDTRLVAAHTQELTSFLWNVHQAGWLRTDFQRSLPFAVGHHVPCHVKALGGEPAGPKLLRLIPKLEVQTVDVGCSGMAGTHGLRTDTYQRSIDIGRPVFEAVRAGGAKYGSAECGGCRMQLHEGTGLRALHPVQYLALAYGLVPAIDKKLKRPLRKRVTD